MFLGYRVTRFIDWIHGKMTMGDAYRSPPNSLQVITLTFTVTLTVTLTLGDFTSLLFNSL